MTTKKIRNIKKLMVITVASLAMLSIVACSNNKETDKVGVNPNGNKPEETQEVAMVVKENIQSYVRLLPLMYTPLEEGTMTSEEIGKLIKDGKSEITSMNGLTLEMTALNSNLISINGKSDSSNHQVKVVLLDDSKADKFLAVEYSYAQVNKIYIYKVNIESSSAELLGSTIDGSEIFGALTVNDFLSENNKVDNLQDYPILYYYDNNGVLYAEPSTWMSPEFEEVEVKYQIALEWAEDKFIPNKLELYTK